MRVYIAVVAILLAVYVAVGQQTPAAGQQTSAAGQQASPTTTAAQGQSASSAAPQQSAAKAQDNAAPPAQLYGFTAESSATEKQWESKFRALPSTDLLRQYMQRLSARPHAVGQPYDRDNAEWILSKFKEWGWDAHIETFDVLFPTPRERVLELVAPTHFVAALKEPAVAVDPTSGQAAEQLPTYNAYSADGDVTAPLVYANYGLPQDYEELARMGVSVKGAIVITRYGGGWRGIKPMVAAQMGAIGCLIYSDPAGDGYYDGQVYPLGAWRPREGVQRGSVMKTIYPGDPLTPGWGATKDAKRLPRDQAQNLQTIPVMPISYGDAQPLLAALGGQVAPPTWRGALPITYRVGPGPARVHLRLMHNWDMKTLYDVIARLPGATHPEQWVLRGNHHDAWVNGADDPISGQVAMLEEARAFGELAKQGWRPQRTLIYCAWDGEEPGLLGSVEWAETHAQELQEHAVAYVNSDSNGRGFFGADGSHTLERLINDAARDVNDPEKNISIWKRAQLHAIADAKDADERKEVRTRHDLRIDALGDGSDYTAFVDHLGIAGLSLGFGGEGGGGVYHSIYDDFYWYTHFADTDLTYGRALAQTAGTAMMRLANADLLPFEFTDFADTVQKYVKELQKLYKDKGEQAQERNLEIEEGLFSANSDPKKPMGPPPHLDTPPAIDLAPLTAAADAITRAAQRYSQIAAGAQNIPAAKLDSVNRLLMQSERKLLDEQGLPGRPWFKHVIYAPGIYTGYAAKTIPGVREALEERRWAEATQQVKSVSSVLQGEAALIEATAAELEKVSVGK